MTDSTTTKNVVVVVIDALRADRVGVHGSQRGLTPVLDSLGEEGVVFDNAFSCINTTDPSVTSLHTGKHPRSTVLHHANLVTEEEKQRIESVEYVPEKLSDAGVKTIATGRPMGRWHRRGFSTYSRTVVEQKEKKISDRLQSLHPAVHRAVSGGYNTVKGLFETDSDDDEERTAVDEFLHETDDQPFYGFIHLMDTHAWYEANPELIDLLRAQNDYPEGGLQSFFDEYSESPVVSNVLEPNATAADYEAGLSRLFARYDATVRQADQKVKTLIDGLKDRDLWEETALFVLSDHGESLDEHGIYFDHHGLYEQTVNVPLVGRVPGGATDRVAEFIQVHDLGPTILDLLDVDPIDDADGRSLTGYLTESTPTPEPRERVFVEEAHTQRRRGVRTAQFKFIDHVHDEVLADAWENDSFECGYCSREHGERTELYDLDEDPEEVENIAAERPEVVEEMQEYLAEFEESHSGGTAVDEAVTYGDEEEILDRLEDLGYR